MSPCGSTVFLLLCLLLATAQGGRILSEVQWPCQQVTPQRNVSLDQIVGQWHLAEGYSPYELPFNTTQCYTIRFTQANESTLSLTGSQQPLADYNIPDANQPWYWNKTGTNVLVVYLAEDTSKMVLAGCVPSRDAQGSSMGHILLSRQLPLSEADTQAVHQALSAKGVTRSAESYSWKSVATCSAATL